MKSRFDWESLLAILWLALLLPWLPFFLASGMAFDGGPTLAAYVFVASIWTYPIAIALVLILRKKSPFITLLPFINVAGLFSELFWRALAH